MVGSWPDKQWVHFQIHFDILLFFPWDFGFIIKITVNSTYVITLEWKVSVFGMLNKAAQAL